jgi:hypothetical protein
LERGYTAEDIAIKWLMSSSSSLRIPISFAERNDAGYDVLIDGQLPWSTKHQCLVEVKGIAKSSDSRCIHLSRNEYLTMRASLDLNSEYDYVVLVVDEVSASPGSGEGTVCGYCTAKSLLKLKGWGAPDQDVHVEATEFRVWLQAPNLVVSDPHRLFVSLPAAGALSQR